AVAEATLLLQRAAGKRRVAFGDFYTGYRQTVMLPDELLVAVEIPALSGRQWFRKVGTRAAQAISKIVMAGIRNDRPRVALGSVAPTVVRLPRTESLLAAGRPLEDAKRTLLEEIRPIDDIRSTADYRRPVAAHLLEQFWRETSCRPPRRSMRLSSSSFEIVCAKPIPSTCGATPANRCAASRSTPSTAGRRSSNRTPRRRWEFSRDRLSRTSRRRPRI